MDKRPKRRRHKDNPYVLEKTNQTYKVSFLDGSNHKKQVSIDQKLYEYFNQCELSDLRELNEFDRHIEHLSQTDELLYSKSVNRGKSVEKVVEEKILFDEIIIAINELSKMQYRRIVMYYLYDMTMEEIAQIEKCSKVAIKHSIDSGIKKIRKNLKSLS